MMRFQQRSRFFSLSLLFQRTIVGMMDVPVIAAARLKGYIENRNLFHGYRSQIALPAVCTIFSLIIRPSIPIHYRNAPLQT